MSNIKPLIEQPYMVMSYDSDLYCCPKDAKEKGALHRLSLFTNLMTEKEFNLYKMGVINGAKAYANKRIWVGLYSVLEEELMYGTNKEGE